MKLINSKPAISKTKTKITLAQKQKICNYKLEHPDKSQKELSIYFSQLFKTTIGRSTIGDILRDSYKWTQANSLESSDFEQHLLIRISNSSSHRPAVNKAFMIEQVLDLCKKFNISENLYNTEEFLASFLQKYKLCLENEKIDTNIQIKIDEEDSDSFDDFFFFTDIPVECSQEKPLKLEDSEEEILSSREEEKYLNHIQALKSTKYLTGYFEAIQCKQGVKFMNKLDQDIEETIFCCKSLVMGSQQV